MCSEEAWSVRPIQHVRGRAGTTVLLQVRRVHHTSMHTFLFLSPASVHAVYGACDSVHSVDSLSVTGQDTSCCGAGVSAAARERWRAMAKRHAAAAAAPIAAATGAAADGPSRTAAARRAEGLGAVDGALQIG